MVVVAGCRRAVVAHGRAVVAHPGVVVVTHDRAVVVTDNRAVDVAVMAHDRTMDVAAVAVNRLAAACVAGNDAVSMMVVIGLGGARDENGRTNEGSEDQT